jgi:tRNA threonylcarbamoyladenosine biosynthesis protein TsaB
MKNWRAGDGIWIHVWNREAWPEEARGPAWALRRQEVKILGIESASLVASVAIVDGDIVVAEYTVDYKKTHSQTLLPMLDEIVRMTEQDLKTVDAIAVSGGPGSFTGLRIGAATAKGLGLALDKPLIHVPTVDAMAYGLQGCRYIISPIMDARRGQVYTGIYSFEDDFEVLQENEAVAIEVLLDQLENFENDVIFLGDGVPVFRNRIIARLGSLAHFAIPACSRQRAALVASLGAKYFAEGKTVTSDAFMPVYLRDSQAERVRKEKLAKADAVIVSGE